jgi:outer membrane protein assembly factor BamB
MRSFGVVGPLILLTLACASEPAGNGLPPGGEAAAAAAALSWPGFGGPDGNFRVRAEGLAEVWPESGPPELWRQPLGRGYSAISIVGTLLYVMSRDGDQDVVQARAITDGSIVWEQRYDSPPRDGHTVDFGTGPNASPLVHDGRVFTLSYSGALHAFEAASGDLVWNVHLMDDFGGDLLDFGYSASPIVHDGKLIVLVGGERQGALALDPADGSVLWRGPPSSVSYSTPIVVDVGGQEQLVFFSAESIIALDVVNGEQLWDFPVVNQYRNNSTGPQWGESGLLWVATQLDGGTRALRLTRSAEGTAVEEVWVSNKMSVHFWNTLRVGDVIFASIGGNGSILAAIDLTDGDILWRQRGFEKVNLLHAGDKTILLDADGTLALARLSPEGIEVLSMATIAEETTWTAPSLVEGILYYRDQSSLRAYDLRARWERGPTSLKGDG